MKRSRRYLDNLSKCDLEKNYSIEEALDLLSNSTNTKFDQTVDLSINFSIN